MKIGEMVEWTSQAGGYRKTKRGKIIAIVPAGRDPEDYIPKREWERITHFGVLPRSHKSFIVQVGNRWKFYWPLVKYLKVVKGGSK